MLSLLVEPAFKCDKKTLPALDVPCNQLLQPKLMQSCYLKFLTLPRPWPRTMHVHHLLKAANAEFESNNLRWISTINVEHNIWILVDNKLVAVWVSWSK